MRIPGLDRIASWLLFSAAALAPLPFGSSLPAAVAVWCVVLGLALAIAPTQKLRAPHLMLLGCAAIVVAAYAIVLHEQLAEHPWFSPHPLWSAASDALGTPLDPSISVARHEPYFALGQPLVCMLALICGFVVCVDRGRARTLLWVLAGSGVAYALYGVAAHLIDPTKVLWRDKPAYIANVTATFINRNTAAVYFGSCAVVCLMLLCDRVRQNLPREPIAWRKLANELMSSTPRDVIVLLAMLFGCLLPTFMSGSRAGVILTLMALIVSFAVYFRHDLPRRADLTAAVLGAGFLAVVLLQFMGGSVNARFDAQGIGDEGRVAVWRATLRLIADYPWFGTGQGTFIWSFPSYRPGDLSMWGIWDHAHDTILELAADMGVPLAILVGAGWLVIFTVLIHGIRVRRRDLLIPISAFAVAMIAVLHSLIDFSLQIPGYSIPALALVGAGLAQSFASERAKANPEAAASERSPNLAPSEAYGEAIEEAALKLLAALRDRSQPEVSTQLLDAMRRRGSAANEGRQFRRENVRTVLADIVRRAAEIRRLEMRGVGAGDDVEAEMGRALHRLLVSVEDAFLVDKDESENKMG
ncbi:MAG: O-antigen ligase family protein [Xanthobacteraceae bacterium]